MANAVVLYTCNDWKENASMELVGVYTNRAKLNKQLVKMFKEKDIEWEHNPDRRPTLKELYMTSINDLNEFIDYAFLQEITLNEEQ